MTIGMTISRLLKQSETVPPATERNADPEIPARNRKMKNTAALFENATGNPSSRKAA